MKLGSLFSGYGGLDMAVMQHFGASLEWYAEFDPAAHAIGNDVPGWEKQAGREIVSLGVAPDADCDGYGEPLHARGVGGVEGGAEGEALEQQRAWGESDAGSAIAWGKYEPAIRRWESITRLAPAPSIPGTNGRHRLNPMFVEWMMGLPEGRVTGRGLRPAQELKMLGNGVVPQQAKYALELLT